MLWLCENHCIVLWLLLGVSTMVAKEDLKQHKRRIGSRLVCAMLMWSWYCFQELLKLKVCKFPWCCLVLMSEAHMTKTCTHCSTPNHDVRRSKVFH